MEGRKSVEKDRHSNSIVHGVKGGPKKGGAGQGNWGVGGTADLVTVTAANRRDPNYDSEDEAVEEVVFEKTEVTSPIQALIDEYFSSGELEEVRTGINELGLTTVDQQALLLRKAMLRAMDRGAYERELTSQLMSSLCHEGPVPAAAFQQAFVDSIRKIDETVVDVPTASELLAKFLARAVVDEVVFPALLRGEELGGQPSNLARDTLALATALTTEKHRIDRLAHVWGPGDLGSVKRLKEETRTLLEEFLTTGDMQEADRCVRRLHAPSFHFQLVKQAIRIALQQTDASKRQQLMKLLAFFANEGLISHDHMAQGFHCCYDTLADIKLDAPQADTILNELTQQAKSEKWLPASFTV